MNWTVIRLAVGVFWLFFGAVALYVDAGREKPIIGGLPFSIGWVAIFVAAYNILRAGTAWLLERPRRPAEEADEAKPMDMTQPDKPVVNPNFQFDKPAGPPETK